LERLISINNNLTIQVRKKLEQIINVNNTNGKEIFFQLFVPSNTFKERRSQNSKQPVFFFAKFRPGKYDFNLYKEFT
jgi:hypothetical protein